MTRTAGLMFEKGDAPVIVIQLTLVISIERGGCHFLQFVLKFLILPLEVNND